MSIDLPSQPPEVFQRRCSALGQSFGSGPALLFCGRPQPRNYPANAYPFRASSHFLYFVGASIPDAVALVCEGTCELYARLDEPGDSLWHGPSPDKDEIMRRTGVSAIHPLEQLQADLGSRIDPAKVAALPANDSYTRALQRRLLHRNWADDHWPAVEELGPHDLRLADGVIALRLTHDDAAVSMVRRALEGTTAAHLAGMAATRPGVFEHHIRAAMERELVACGMECAYPSIVTVHGEVLHNNRYNNRLTDGDLVLADVGGEYEGWASDVTRTWPVSGAFSPTQQALYDLVLAANEAAIAMVRPGVRYRDIHRKACSVLVTGLIDEGILAGDAENLLDRGVHAVLFPHGVGHLLGLDVHDMEDLGDRAGYASGRRRSAQFGLGFLRLDRDLTPGMIVTIEPGLYLIPEMLGSHGLFAEFVRDGSLRPAALERFSDVRGIRIEDDVLCTPTDPVVLSAAIPKATRDLLAQVGRT